MRCGHRLARVRTECEEALCERGVAAVRGLGEEREGQGGASVHEAYRPNPDAVKAGQKMCSGEHFSDIRTTLKQA